MLERPAATMLWKRELFILLPVKSSLYSEESSRVLAALGD